MNKKIILAVLLGLLASASSLIAGVFTLQQMKNVSSVPLQVENLAKQIASIDTTIDLSGVQEDYNELVTQFNVMASDVQELQTKQQDLFTLVNNGANYNVDENNNPSQEEQTPQGTNEETNNTNETQEETTPPTNNEQATENQNQKQGKTTVRLNLRTDAGEHATIIKTLDKNATVTILGEEKKGEKHTWIKVQSGNQTGWVAKEFVK